MNAYKVKNSPILHNGKRYEVGADISLSESEAAPILIYLTPVAPKKEKAAKKSVSNAEKAINADSDLKVLSDELVTELQEHIDAVAKAAGLLASEGAPQLAFETLTEWEMLYNDDLKAILEANGVEYAKNAKKPALVELVSALDAKVVQAYQAAKAT